LDDSFYVQYYRSLYRLLSAALLLDRWDSLKRLIQKHSNLLQFQNLDDDDLEIILKCLVEPEAVGYQRLQLADKADFVQRDALYFGTVRLDIAPKHLYSGLVSDAQDAGISEERLIDVNLQYLQEKFYDSDDIICFSRLYEKIVASLLVTEEFREDWLTYDDDQFKRLICENLNKENKPENLESALVDKAKALFDGNIIFDEVFRLEEIRCSARKNALELEEDVIGDQDRPQLLSYPFDRGILATVDSLPGPPVFEPSFLIRIFQDKSKKNLGELLKSVQTLGGRLSANHVKHIREQLGNQLSSTKNVRINNKRVLDCIAEAIQSIEEITQRGFLNSFVSTIFTHPAVVALLSYPEYLFWSMPEPMRKHDKEYVSSSAELLLCLPLYLLYDQFIDAAITRIYKALVDLIPKKSENMRGYFFEAACVLDRLLAKKQEFQFLINGMVVTDPQRPKGQEDTNEFDIIQLFFNDYGTTECWIHACTIKDNPRSYNREQISKLAEKIHDVFPDAIVRQLFVTPKDKKSGDWSPHYEAGPVYNGFQLYD
jgi:hypothetical protein